MEEEKKDNRSRSSSFFLAFIVFIIIVLSFMVDVATCPTCSGHEILYAISKGKDCPTCHSKGKVTVWQFLLRER